MDHAYQSNVSQIKPTFSGYQAGYPQPATPTTPATVPGPGWFYMITEELRNLLLAGGVIPDAFTMTQVSQAVALVASNAATQAVLPFSNQVATAVATASTASAAATSAQQTAALLVSASTGLPKSVVGVFGAVGDGTHDDTSAFTLAAASGSNLYIPPGAYLIRDRIVFQNGVVVQGAGRTRSYFVIDASFNMAASGVVRLGTSEPGAQLLDIGFRFSQANQGARGSVTHYPPAIDTQNLPRFILDRIRIEGAYDGILATGNCGGAFIGFIEVGALNRGIYIDGSLDFFHGGNWHFWPFGISGLSSLFNGVYLDGSTQAVVLGQCDGMDINSITAFSCSVTFNNNADAGIPNLINTVHLDGDGARLIVSNGVIGIGQLYETKSTVPTLPTISVTAGYLSIGQHFSISSNPGGIARVSGSGSLVINGGRVSNNNASNSAFAVSGGGLDLYNVEFIPPQLAFTAPHVSQSGVGLLRVSGCKWAGNGTGSGVAVALAADNPFNFVEGNQFNGWQYSPPAAYTSGIYGPNGTPLKAWTPTAAFATPGDFAPTYAVQVGRYREENGGFWFECRLVFSTNAYTSASGTFSIYGMPNVNGGIDSMEVPIGRASFITLSSGYTMLTGSVPSGASRIDLTQSGSGMAVLALTQVNILPSRSNIEISIAGFVPSI